jgi:hypothetical protein
MGRRNKIDNNIKIKSVHLLNLFNHTVKVKFTKIVYVNIYYINSFI